jgi:hypothetical protein
MASTLLEIALLDGGEPAQGFAHLCQSALDSGQGRRIRICLAAAIDPLPKSLHFDFQRLQGSPRQRFGKRAADLGKIGAQAHDGLLEIPRWTQRFDAGCYLAQLFLQAANIDRRLRRGLRSGERSV